MVVHVRCPGRERDNGITLTKTSTCTIRTKVSDHLELTKHNRFQYQGHLCTHIDNRSWPPKDSHPPNVLYQTDSKMLLSLRCLHIMCMYASLCLECCKIVGLISFIFTPITPSANGRSNRCWLTV